MLTNCQQRIMEVLLPQPFKAHSIRQISKLIKKSYALVHQSVNSLIDKKMIKAKKIGHSLVCEVNLAADPQLLAMASLEHSRKFLSKVRFSFVVDEIKNKLYDLIYIMVLFGSYAKGKAAGGSDVDLLFVVQNEKDIEKTKRKIKEVLSSTKIKVEFEVVTVEWLVKMFEEKHSVGREVLENSLVFHGAEQYYSLVRVYDQKRRY